MKKQTEDNHIHIFFFGGLNNFALLHSKNIQIIVLASEINFSLSCIVMN